MATAPRKLETTGIKRLINDALWAQNVRHKSQFNGRRYEFQVDHGLRKWFKTRCEIGGMKSINIEILMGHSIGISDSYYRITQDELLESYLKIQSHLLIDKKNLLQEKQEEHKKRNDQDNLVITEKLQEKDEEIFQLKKDHNLTIDNFAALNDKVLRMMEEIEILKANKKAI
jgi:hypothetical protein